MRDPLLAAHQSKLATYESAGLTDLADRQRAAIAKLEKAAKAADKVPTVVVEEGGDVVKAVKKAAKKTAKKTAKK